MQEAVVPVVSMEGEKVVMGPLRRELLPLYDRWHNDFETATTYFRGDLRPDRLEDTEARYERIAKEVRFTIYERSTMLPIGISGLEDVDHYNRTANFGILIGEKACRNRGYGTEATALTLDWAFLGLGLHSVLLTVFAYNLGGIRAYLRAGFKEVGRWREAKRLAGQAYDVIYMDCLATEFQSLVLRQYLPTEGARRPES